MDLTALEGLKGLLVRFKCLDCSDYDLCSTCEAKTGIHDPTHVFLKIPKPSQSSGRGCPYRRPWSNSGEKRWGRSGNWNGRFNTTNATAQSSQSRYLSRFVADLSIEDGSYILPEQPFVKIWKMRNEGTTAWPEGTRLIYVGGDKTSNSESVVIPPIEPDVEIDIAVDMVAPSKPGRYVSYWRLVGPDGVRFGQRVWVDIVVTSESQESKDEKSEKIASMEVEIPTIQPTPIVQEVQPIPEVMEVQPISQIPQIPISVEVPISSEHQQLIDMGFRDKELNKKLLSKHNNDVLKTVQELLNY